MVSGWVAGLAGSNAVVSWSEAARRSAVGRGSASVIGEVFLGRLRTRQSQVIAFPFLGGGS
jgi:hypothetical protein